MNSTTLLSVNPCQSYIWSIDTTEQYIWQCKAHLALVWRLLQWLESCHNPMDVTWSKLLLMTKMTNDDCHLGGASNCHEESRKSKSNLFEEAGIYSPQKTLLRYLAFAQDVFERELTKHDHEHASMDANWSEPACHALERIHAALLYKDRIAFAPQEPSKISDSGVRKRECVFWAA